MKTKPRILAPIIKRFDSLCRRCGSQYGEVISYRVQRGHTIEIHTVEVHCFVCGDRRFITPDDEAKSA